MTLGSLVAHLIAWQRVVYERPPEATLQRGLVALPRAPTVAVVLLAVTGLLTYALRARLRARRAPTAPRHAPR